MGTPWELDLRGKVFFFENVRRAPVEVDRMLAQLLLMGKLQECAGIVIGEHFDCGPKTPGPTLSLEELPYEPTQRAVAAASDVEWHEPEAILQSFSDHQMIDALEKKKRGTK